LGHGRARRQV